MKFNKVAIENFGVYEGVHEFDLKTNSRRDDSPQNLIIVKGPNGSGKSTFFKAIGLALFGRQALGFRVSQKEYDGYILSRFHKARFADNPVKTDYASISILLEFVESGKRHEIKIHRSWTRNRSNVSEKLSVLKDDHPPEVQEMDYQTWLTDLFPPGLKTILCFDTEDMNALVRAKDDEELKKVVKRLLGLHLVEQLERDLDYYLQKGGGGTKYDTLKNDVVVKQQIIDRYKDQIQEEEKQRAELESEEKELTSNLKRLERDLASEGGDYAARRPIIKDRIHQLDEEIEKYENKLRELATGLLPFTLAPTLSYKLNQRLDKELELHRKQIASQYLQDKFEELADDLSKSAILKKLKINKTQSKKIISYLKESLELEERKNGQSNALVHELSENDILKLQSWVKEVENSIPKLALHLSDELKEKKAEKDEHQEYLNRAPDDDKLEPLFEQIREVEERLRELRKEIRYKDEEIGSLQYKLDEVLREQEKIADKIKEVEKEVRKFSLAERSQLALKSYHDALARKQIQKLCKELVYCFNQICEKDQLLSEAYIDPETFEVTLTDQGEEVIPVDDLSMGESQIYGLSLLWALRRISGYELPLLIDTPIARLDKTHRDNFIHKYLPEVSKQVILFATNAEMESHIQEEFEPFVSHLYDLYFDEEIGSTIVVGEGHNKADEVEV